MKINNVCCILKSDTVEELDSSYSYNVQTGEPEQKSGWKGTTYYGTVPVGMEYRSKKPVFIPESDIVGEVQVLMYDIDNNYLGYRSTTSGNTDMCELDINTYKVLVNFRVSSNYNSNRERIWYYCGYPVEAIYSKLEKALKRENAQMFFRETLNGNVSLVGKDYMYVNTANLEQNMLFAFFTNGKLKAKSVFNRTDCKFDPLKKSVTLKLSPVDKYTDILNRYEDTFDLMKMTPRSAPPKITPLTLTKRMALQVYIKGANDVTTIANGAYWQNDVNEVVDSDSDLTGKYHFAKDYTFKEIHIETFSGYGNGTYVQIANEDTWKSVSKESESFYHDIHFEKMYSAGDHVSGDDATNLMVNGGHKFSDDVGMHAADVSGTGTSHSGTVLVDVYKIQIRRVYTSVQAMFVEFQSEYFYVIDNVDNGFKMSSGSGKYKMISGSSSEIIYLGENIINYDIYTRIIADVDKVQINGTEQTLYNLPYDDFTYTRANYKKCIGVADSPYWKFYQASALLNEPTKYGMDDYGKYFTSNFNSLGTLDNKPIPISRSSWANTSIWFAYTFLYWDQDYESKYRTEYTLKDAYSLSDVISALLKAINPEITHQATSEFSNFLYGGSGMSLGENQVFISPKSNVLKSNYDQAAKKAEITFKQLMDMLKECFRCYWFIDEQNRFRIEHISYFLNGFSYSSPQIGLDLTTEHDKFNKKTLIYRQEEIEYSKSELDARYEFSWSDDSTDLFGNNIIDINSQYVQKDKVETVSPDLFDADIDFMLFAPDKFSSDGFALILANKETKKVPIVKMTSYFKDSEYDYAYTASVQNWYASWLYLIGFYMYDMPARRIECSGIFNQPHVQRLKMSMSHSFQYSDYNDPDLTKLVKTALGNGLIDEVSINLSTRLIAEKVIYEPL